MIISLKGENFTGKSGFGLGCPFNIGWHETDIGGFDRAMPFFERAVPDLRERITYHAYPTPEETAQRDLGVATTLRLHGVKELWYEFVTNFLSDIDDSNIHTIVVDTFSQLYPICMDAYLQEIQERQEMQPARLAQDGYRERLQQVEYGRVHQRMHAIFDIAARAAQTSPKTLVIMHHMDDLWGKVQKGDKVEDGVIGRTAKGWHKCGYGSSDLVDYVIQMAQGGTSVAWGNARQDPNKFYSTLEKSGVARSLKGTVIEDMTYDDLMARIAMARGT